MKFQFPVRSAIAFLLCLSASSTAAADQAHTGWHLNFTPTLFSQDQDYGLGGGIDPELRYEFGGRVAYLSYGVRAGAYYAKKLFGTMVMPTVRLALPTGVLEPYAAFGAGYGWLPKSDDMEFARMYRGGFVYHFNSKLGLGIEGTYQEILHTGFHFFSLGSMVSFGF